MKEPSRALLIVGSLKRPRSTSRALGSYVLDRLKEHGWETEALHLTPVLCKDEGHGGLQAAVGRADLLVLAFPLYYFSLPALATRALELIAAERGKVEAPRPQRLLAICNCGFPEAVHNDLALRICRGFAEQSGIEWSGGLGMGAGESVGGQPLAAGGGAQTGGGKRDTPSATVPQGMLRHVVRALDLAAEAVAEGRPVPQEAVDLMAKPLMPQWLYTTVGNLGWRQRAWKNGALLSMGRRPYSY